ncbi:hypothetical protein GCM10010387_40860 [Streptomyces inusitatus]|uniref:Peptidoglycan binding domain-containing protein n=1 Tax=Streptomyces inusitatus TaxID=68221 RepID=A0A918UYJ5_9ACTN|nr:hypothetical protein [Streptomyces inusitatus]GGZ42401.1 hypothetical protein GCM10010387_40860 [Streptomyces inusitatus]
MSRETDSSSSGPQGRGGAAYPSGTPPYGSRQYPSPQSTQDTPDGAAAGAADGSPEQRADGARTKSEPKTETTLTTRIRINIPGSRPIPPVVMRKPMADADSAPGAPGAPGAAEADIERTAAMPVIGGPDASAPAAPAPAPAPAAVPPAEEKAAPNDWFAPRRGSTNGAGMPSPAAGADAPAAQPAPPGVPAAPQPPTPAQGLPPTPHGLPPGPLDIPSGYQGPVPGGAFAGTAPGPQDPFQTQAQGQAQGQSQGPADSSRGAAPAGPDAVPAPRRPASGAQGMMAGLQGTAPTQPAAQDALPAPRGPVPGPQGGAHPAGASQPRSALSDLAAGGGMPSDGPAAPTGATSGPARGTMPLGRRSGKGAPAGPGGPAGGPPRMSDDTAVLTPQKPAPGPAAGPGPGGQVSGDTLTSGIPVVPAEQRGPGARGPKTKGGPKAKGGGAPPASAFPSGPGPGPGPAGGPGGSAGPAGSAGPEGSAAPAFPFPAPTPAPARSAPPAKNKKKGRSKLVLLGVAVVGLAGVAYGAGLLLNHSEVPKSTKVLGVDIGGGTKEQAVVKLQQALGKRAATPLQLTVGGKKVQLAPDKAGLVLDSQETVRKAAGSDYNPVSVIGSLFGDARVVEPEIPVDEEKLSVALTDLAGESGSAVEGTIKFEPGKAVAVPGKPGQTLDVSRSMISVKDAFRAQVETGKPSEVQLPVAKREPTIGQDEIDRAMKEFAEPAMSGLITIKAGGRDIPFGPSISLPQILSMKPVDGKLVEVYDKEAIERLMGQTFVGVLITKGDGKQHQLTPTDIAQAMGPALRGKTPEERTVEIPLNPS